MKINKAFLIPVFIGFVQIILWHILAMVASLVVLLLMAGRYFGGFEYNEAFWAVIPITLGSFFVGFLGVFPAYFSYNLLLKKLTARFGFQVDRPKRLFAFSALLTYGFPLLLLFWALVKP